MPTVLDYGNTDTSVSSISYEKSPQGKSSAEVYAIMQNRKQVKEENTAAFNKRMEESDATLGGYIKKTFKQESMFAAVHGVITDLGETTDLDFDPNEFIDKEEDLDEWQKGALRGTVNKAHYDRKLIQTTEQKLYKEQGEFFGGAGVAAQMGALLLHPEFLLLGVGETALLGKLAMKGVAKFTAGAAVGAATNTAQELAIIANNKSRDKMGAIIAAGTGAALGGMFSAIPTVRKDAQDLHKAEKLLGKDYANTVKGDFDILKRKKPFKTTAYSSDFHEAVDLGRISKDTATGKYTMNVKGRPITYHTKEEAERAYKTYRDAGGFEAGPTPREAAEGAETVTEGVPEVIPETTAVPIAEVMEDLGKNIKRRKSYAGPLESIGAEGMASKNPVVRAITNETLEYAPGTGGKVVATHSASLDGHKTLMELKSTFHPVRLDSMKSWKRTHRKRVMPWDKSAEMQFDKDVVKELAYRKYPSSRAAGIDVDPDIKRTADAYEVVEVKRFNTLQNSGAKGYAGIEADSLHIERHWDSTMLNRIKNSHGEPFVKNLIKKGILASNEFKNPKYSRLGDKLTDEYLDRTADHMASAIFERMIRRQDTVNIARATHITRQDRKLLEKRLTEIVDNPADVKHIMAATSDRDTRAMHEYMRQIDVDLNTTVDGISIVDLLDNGLGRQMDTNFRRSAGKAAMAKKGIKSQEDFLDITEAAARWSRKNEPNKGSDQIAKDTTKLQKLWNVVLGDNIEAAPDSTTSRVMRGLRRLATLSSMNQVGFAQFSEFGRLVGAVGVRNFMKQIPELRTMRRDMITGKYADDMLGDIETAFSVRIGDNHLLDHPVLRSDAGGYGLSTESSNAFMRGLDTVSNKLLHVQGYINGMNQVMRLQQRMHARGFFMNMSDDLTKGLSPARLRRYADVGLSEADLKVVAKEMKTKASRTKGWFGQDRIESFNLANFEPDIREKLALAFHKSQNQAIQKHMAGETGWMMESAFGKLMTQFRTFPIVALEKQSIHDLKHLDSEAFVTMMASFGFASTAYMAKTYANSFGLEPKKRKKYLKNRLTPEAIAAGAIRWTGQSSVAPEIFELGESVGLGNPFRLTDSKQRDYNRHKGDLKVADLSPGLSIANSAYRFATGVGQAVLTGDELTWSTTRHATRLIPYNGAVGFKNYLNTFNKD